MAKPSRTDEIAAELMSTAEVAAYFDIAPTAVRGLLRRYDIHEVRGYVRVDVEAIERLGQGARTDLRRKYYPPAPPRTTT